MSPVARQSADNQVNLVLEVVGFFAHLYVPAEVFTVAPAFVHETPLDILVAACAGAEMVNPPAMRTATESEEILRNMSKPFVGNGQILVIMN